MKEAGSIIVVVLFVVGLFCIDPVLGIYPYGPERTVVTDVTRTYVDVSGGKESTKSHYMVATDAGVFEIDNSLWLGFFTADELYGKIKAGQSYRFTTKGNKVVGFWCQEYPYIISAVPIESQKETETRSAAKKAATP